MRTAAAVIFVAVLVAGCTDHDDIDDIPPEHVAAGEAYVTQLNALVDILSVIDDQGDAREAAPAVELSVTKIAALHTQIQDLPPKSRRAVRQHFAGRVFFANRKINEQAVRLLGKRDTAMPLRGPLTPVSKYIQ
jgi:outer membrane murein-binding lipoprotein Lpp